ncbi:MAG TPA: hypothetical protein VNU97_13970 [Rhizomicrobium sp.]|jgi:hypothetical protein|nr:hypothetical protein [Rhizomicrobium sp.]
MKRSQIAVLVLFAMNLAFIGWLGASFVHAPQKSVGDHQVAFAMHGTTVYVSHLQSMAYWGGWILGVVLLAIAVAGYLFSKDNAGK